MTEPIRNESIVEGALVEYQARRDFARRGAPTSALPAATGLHHARV